MTPAHPASANAQSDADRIFMISPLDVFKFRELTARVIVGEKPGFWSDWTPEQQALYTSGDWRAFR